MEFLKRHKRLILLFSSFALLLVLTGCGVDYAKDEAGKIVVDELTGARVIENMIDTNTSLKDAWALIVKGDLFDGLLVVPLSVLITTLGEVLGYGLAIIISTILMRTAVYPITKKSTVNSQRMAEMQPKMEKINKKYRGKEKDREAQTRKQQEVMALYQKEGINPLKGCISPFITLPLFIAFFSAIYRTKGIYTDRFLGINLANTPKISFEHGEYLVVLLILFVVVSNYFSMKVTTAGQNNPQTKNLPIMMTVMIAVFSISIPAGVALYWGTGSIVMIVQTLITKRKRIDK